MDSMTTDHNAGPTHLEALLASQVHVAFVTLQRHQAAAALTKKPVALPKAKSLVLTFAFGSRPRTPYSILLVSQPPLFNSDNRPLARATFHWYSFIPLGWGPSHVEHHLLVDG
jgi:hypothetical protein